MKKKIILQLALVILTIVMPLVMSSHSQNQHVMARITLPADLKPDQAPEVDLKNFKDSGKGTTWEAAVYTNYFLQLIAGGLLYLAGPIAILIIAIGGLRYVVSHGNQTQMENAKKTLEYGLVGLAVIIFSFAIIKAIIAVIVGGVG